MTSREHCRGIRMRAASADDLVERVRIHLAAIVITALNAYLRMGFSIIESVSGQYYMETVVKPSTDTGKP